jgi:NADH:ubiquinone oxidoreductase subunit K
VGFLFFAGVVVWGSPVGLLFLFVLLACAAAETAIGLSLLAVWYRFDGSPLVRALVGLRG